MSGQVVFVREEVAVYPNRSQHIMGRLSLVKQHGVLFLAWLPYSAGSLGQDGSFQVRPALLATRAQHLGASCRLSQE